MSKGIKIGFLLVILGLFIPSILYPFTSYTVTEQSVFYSCFKKGFLYRPEFRDLEVVFIKGKWKRTGSEIFEGHYEERLAVPYRYTIALGITLLFSGITVVFISKNKETQR